MLLIYKILRYFFAWVIMVTCCNSISYSQTILITEINNPGFRHIKKLIPSSKQKDSLSVVRAINKMMASLYDEGYLAASVMKFEGNNDTLFLGVEVGPRFTWMSLSNGNIDEGILSEAGFREKLYDLKPLRLRSIAGLNKKILTYCENNGYPFASLKYENFNFSEGAVSAELMLDTDRKITIDSVIVRGNSKLSRKYLYNYLGIKPGDIYDESAIMKIPGRVKELPMVNEINPFSVAFTEETARIILQLEDKKASQIDGIIGVLPDNSQPGKVQVTGDLRIRLLSSFGQGELFDLNWKQPKQKTQDLKVNLNYPFLFSSPFGIDLKLGIYKLDSSYIEINLGAGIQFLLKHGNYLKVFVDDKKSNLLSTKAYENTNVLPPFADIQRTSYGIGFKSVNLDYRLNPRKGYALEATASAGNRIIKKNSQLNEQLYDSLDLKSLQFNGQASIDWYIPLFSRNVINLGIMGGGIGGENTFGNELYRIGGLHTLRGFDEESITSSLYAIGKIELRYILEQNSYLFAFYNVARYERDTKNEYISDNPMGFGAGITFETKLGIFSFNYALGKEFNNPVKFRAAKIHFGLVNYF